MSLFGAGVSKEGNCITRKTQSSSLHTVADEVFIKKWLLVRRLYDVLKFIDHRL